jgi:hypothetical protein
MGVMSTYGKDDTPAASPAALLADFPNALPGGLAVISADREILPSCCCGLESWSEWEKVLVAGHVPWTGHDPAPLVEIVDDKVQVWSDGAMGDKPTNELPILFTCEDFLAAITRVRNDLEGFIAPLDEWLCVHAPSEANDLRQHFRTAFIR